MSYRIQPGDTLWALSRRFNTTVEELARINNIKNPNLIYAGAMLKTDGAAAPGRRGGSAPVDRFEGPSIGPGGIQITDAMRKLAAAGRSAAMGMGGYNSQGLCATGVSRALRNALGIGVWGNGNQIDNNLPKDKFRQINISLEEALKIPGLILTWEATGSAAGSIYGHTAITLGDGHSSASDFIENYTHNNGRSGFKVFLPLV